MAYNENKRLQLKAEVFKAMGHPLRLGVIELLQDGEKCVCEIVEQVGTEISNDSKHLSVLKKGRHRCRPQGRSQDHVSAYHAVCP